MLVDYKDEIPLIQRLVVECDYSEMFWKTYGCLLYLASSLETFTILHFDIGAVHESWWRD